ncbi:MAG: hypothetical protein F4X11_24030 [Acidobacteria bacterium]|nr:hypothetical protein [Acidobacteriota bacterium]
MHDAIQPAQGKPRSPLRVVYIGTLAPATSGWWHDVIDDGSHARHCTPRRPREVGLPGADSALQPAHGCLARVLGISLKLNTDLGERER